MKNFILLFLIINLYIQTPVAAEQIPGTRPVTDANIFGHVLDAETGEHLPFVSIGIKGTSIGTTTDQTGHFTIINAPVGTYILQASYTGYKTIEKLITTEKGKTIEADFELERDMLRLDEVVVTGSRYEQRRSESPTITSSLTPLLFSNVQALVLGEGLNYTPGLRMETNCSNCGFNQVRINGLEGPYSQILINGRPIFSGLAAVYGLELIPANMIDRVEVVRGGSSVLYGSNAIAGTINLRLKDPVSNVYEIGSDIGLVGAGLKEAAAPALDRSLNANVSVVSSSHKTGLSIFGFSRNREPFDANDDGFTELVLLKNTTFGSRVYQRLSNRSKLTADFFRVNEYRRGGNRFDYPVHQSDIAESLAHRITTGGLTFEQFLRESDMISMFVSAQHIERDSYYGAERSLADYGYTEDITMNAGANYRAEVTNGMLIFGADLTAGKLSDQKLGYPDIDNAVIENDSVISIPYIENTILAKQNSMTSGVYVQYERNFERLKVSAGGRFDYYQITNEVSTDAGTTGGVFVPKVSFLYTISPFLQGRLSYARGYRAPQIFDEDLHLSASGSRKVIYRNQPGLKQENSNGLTASLDFNKMIGKTSVGLLVEGFYTQLTNPFNIEFGEPDENGTTVYLRGNSEKSAAVQGINIELNMSPWQKYNLTAGYNIQSSRYEEAQEFDEKRFLRTPNNYGFFSVDWKLDRKWSVSASGSHTGSMLVPYFGPDLENPEDGELRQSRQFFDLGLKVGYNIRISETKMNFYAGVKNLLNSYQSDFDFGIDRDPSYVYGPSAPRMVYVGFKFGNNLF
jgi:outer membrane receptor for ferrienterochelin and colicins